MRNFLCFVSILALTAVLSFAGDGKDDKSASALGQNKNLLFMQLTEEERTYLSVVGLVRLSVDPNNNPISFYNSEEYMWQGVAFDVLVEIQNLTGLTFEIVNHYGASHSDIINLVESGMASFFPTLIRTSELEKRFIWSEGSSEIIFGFNKNEQILRSIFNKALRFIDVGAVRR